MENIFIYRYTVLGSRKLSNFTFAILIFLGSIFFLKASIFSFLDFKTDTLNDNIVFFPQGLVMGFYSLLGLMFTFYSLLTFFLKIGFGYNEFNKKENVIRIFRWGFPGKNRRIEACYSINDIKSIKISSNTGTKNISISLKGDIDIPFIREGFSDSFSNLEEQAIDIASFLGIPLVYNQ